jgi:hypothetical protein
MNPSHTAAAGLAGGGDGPGPTKPGPWRLSVGCSVLSPGDGAAISGAEPGTQFTVVVQAVGTASNSLTEDGLCPHVSVVVDEHLYAAIRGPDGDYTAQCCVCRSGRVIASVTAYGSSKSAVSTVQLQASLQSASPSLTLNEPSSGSSVGLARTGPTCR